MFGGRVDPVHCDVHGFFPGGFSSALLFSNTIVLGHQQNPQRFWSWRLLLLLTHISPGGLALTHSGTCYRGRPFNLGLIGCVSSWTDLTTLKMLNLYLKPAKPAVFNINQIAVNPRCRRPSLWGNRGEMQQTWVADRSPVVCTCLKWEHWYWQGRILLQLEWLRYTGYHCFGVAFLQKEASSTTCMLPTLIRFSQLTFTVYLPQKKHWPSKGWNFKFKKTD